MLALGCHRAGALGTLHLDGLGSKYLANLLIWTACNGFRCSCDVGSGFTFGRAGDADDGGAEAETALVPFSVVVIVATASLRTVISLIRGKQ